jgi:hypothetical protein
MCLAILAVVLAIGAPVVAYSFVQRTVLVRDDFQRGQRMGEAFKDAPPIKGLARSRSDGKSADDEDYEVRDLCWDSAGALYGHHLGGSGEDKPPRSEKAFFVGCSGFSYGGIQGRFND